MPKVIIENTNEKFSKSECDCATCKRMNETNNEWDEFVPKTNLQKRMVEIVECIESREKEKDHLRPRKRRKR
jgi:hypothetical protein